MSKGPLVRQTLAQSAERKKYMDITEPLKCEREKDRVARYGIRIEPPAEATAGGNEITGRREPCMK